MRGDLVLIPVAVGTPRSGDVGDVAGTDQSAPPALLALTDDAGQWRRRVIDADPEGALDSLLEALPDGYRDILEFNEISPQPVTFVDETQTDGRVSLIYSIALPSAVAELLAGDDARWVPLVWPARTFSEAKERGPAMINTDLPYTYAVLDFWRQSLEETTAAFAFLPQYFTIRQLREIYSAVWGYEQDFNAFKNWALDVTFWEERPKPGTLGSYLEDVGTAIPGFDVAGASSDDTRAFRVDADGEVIVDLPGDPAAAERLQQRLKIARAASVLAGGAAGAAATTVALPVLAAAGPALAVSYVTGAAIHSYLRATSTAGKKPTWYMRKSQRPVVHDRFAKVYSPRPAWMYLNG